MKYLPLLFLILSNLLFLPKPVSALTNFNTSYESRYQVLPSGKTKVIISVSLKNNLPSVYANSYTLTIGSNTIRDIKVSGQSGPLQTKTDKTNNKTNIYIEFLDPVIGKNKAQNFQIEFVNLDIAVKSGNVWEINIPILEDLANIDKYTVAVDLPNNLPAPSYVQPASSTLTWNKSSLSKNGIRILLGDSQQYNFHLKYHQNSENSQAFSIALPPDTAFQTVNYTSLDPSPNNVTIDPDGNYLAHYTASEANKLPDSVSVDGSVTVHLKPVNADNLRLLPKPNKKLIATQPFWPVTDSLVNQIATRYPDPQSIYTYVTQSLKYDYTKAADNNQRLGALSALKNPNYAVCMEFTDLFITLARNRGIPAREINGYAVSNNPVLRPISLKKDILHAWPEYYNSDTQVWTPVDPTWGNTSNGIDYFSTLDLTHIVFAIHGQSSLSPKPAGTYKDRFNPQKDIDISIATNAPNQPQPLAKTLAVLYKPLPAPISNLKSTSGQITLKNTSGQTLYLNQLSLLSPPSVSAILTQPKIPVLPPFGSITLDYKLKLLQNPNQPLTITLAVNGYEYEKNVSYQYQNALSQHLTYVVPIIILIIIGGLLGLRHSQKKRTEIKSR